MPGGKGKFSSSHSSMSKFGIYLAELFVQSHVQAHEHEACT